MKTLKSACFIALFSILAWCSALAIACDDKVVWKDKKSGLTWQIMPTGGTMKWAAAKSHCSGLSLGGNSDWRLPTISELRSLIRGWDSTQKGGSCGVTDSCLYHSCFNTPCLGSTLINGGPGSGGKYWSPALKGNEISWHWSSSAVADHYDGAWVVYFTIGDVEWMWFDFDYSVRCVRSTFG